jgi:hypothetical protein
MSCLIRTDYYARLPVASAAPFRCGAAVSPMAQTSQSEGDPFPRALNGYLKLEPERSHYFQHGGEFRIILG